MENRKSGEMRLTQRTLRTQRRREKRGRQSEEAWGRMDQDLGEDLGDGVGDGDG